MINIINYIKFWIGNARPYSAPITLLCWLVAFIYGIKHGGNPSAGVIAYFGIALVHLATNLSDDYFDYKRLKNFTNSEKTIKCAYLRNGQATLKELRNVILFMLISAGIIGIFLTFLSGWKVLLFMIAAAPIALFYSKLSSRGLGDFAVILAYGPLMYGGISQVMLKSLPAEIFIISLASAIFVNTILYTHMLMDYDADVKSGKMTLCTRLKTKENALKGLAFLYLSGYIIVGLLAIKTSNYLWFLTYLTMPLAIDLIHSVNQYNKYPNTIPQIHLWHLPMEQWQQKISSGSAPFFFRFLYSRNITTYYMLLACFAILFE